VVKKFYFVRFALVALVLVFVCGCHLHKKPKRGVLVRGDWAVEFNRTPWIGNSAEVEYEEVADCDDDSGFLNKNKLKSCLPKLGRAKTEEWNGEVVPDSENSPNNNNDKNNSNGVQEITPEQRKAMLLNKQLGKNGQPANGAAVSPTQTLAGTLALQNLQSLQNPQTPLGTLASPPVAGQPHYLPMPGTNGLIGQLVMPTGSVVPGARLLPNGNVIAPNGLPLPATNIHPTGSFLASNGMIVQPGGIVLAPSGTYIVSPAAAQQNAVTIATQNGVPSQTIIAMQSGVPTQMQNGMMLAGGVMMPNGGMPIVNSGAVLMPNGLVAMNGVADGNVAPNSVMLANGLVNPVNGQPVAGLTMSGYPQVGYPPIGYARNGYSPGHAQPAESGEYADEEQTMAKTERENDNKNLVSKSAMPAPRHHPVPTKPVFERSKGLVGEGVERSQTSNGAADKTNAQDSKAAQAAVIRQAYLTGMVAAMRQQQAQQQAGGQQVVPVAYNMPTSQQTMNPMLQQQLLQQQMMQQQMMQQQQVSPYYNQTNVAKPGLLTNPHALIPVNSNTPILGFLGLAKNEQQPNQNKQQHNQMLAQTPVPVAVPATPVQVVQPSREVQASITNNTPVKPPRQKKSAPLPSPSGNANDTDEDGLSELLAMDDTTVIPSATAPAIKPATQLESESPSKPQQVKTKRNGVAAPLPPTIQLAGFEMEE
jgi:hypothetical protein